MNIGDEYRRIILLTTTVSAALLAAICTATAGLILNETFDYGADGGHDAYKPPWNDGTGRAAYSTDNYTFSNSNYSNTTFNVTNNASTGSYLGSSGSGTPRGAQLTFTNSLTGTFWVSALMRSRGINASGLRDVIALNDQNYSVSTPNADFFGIFGDAEGNAVPGVYLRGSSTELLGTKILTNNNVHLLIARVEINASADDAIDLWVFRESDDFGTVPVVENLGTPQISATTADFGSELKNIWLGRYGTSNTHNTDAIRISERPAHQGLSDVLGIALPAALRLEETGSGTAVSEAGQTDTFTVYLQSEPTNDVTVTCGYDSDLLELSPDVLTFTPANYYIEQVVTVSVAAAASGLPDVTDAVVTNTVTSSDVAYNGITTNLDVTVVGDGFAGYFRLLDSTYTVNEEDGNIAVGVQRVLGFAGAVTVDFATQDGTATGDLLFGTDYVATNGSLSWADSEATTNYINISILDNEIYDDTNVYFTINLSNPSAGELDDPTSATITIIDNDPQGEFSFTTTSASIDEDAGTLTVYVERVNGSNDAAEVSFHTVNGSRSDGNNAIAGTDYTAVSSTVNWNHLEGGAKSIEITILEDSTYTGERFFTIELTGADVGTIEEPNVLTVEIIDNSPFALRDQFLNGGTPANGEYSISGLNNQSPHIAGAANSWGSAGSTAVRNIPIEHEGLPTAGVSIGHTRSDGGYTGCGRDLSRSLGSGSDPYTVWFASLHMINGFQRTINISHWQYDLGGGTIRWGLYETQKVHAFGEELDDVVAGVSYLFITKLEKNYSGSDDRWSVWVYPEGSLSTNGMAAPDATGTSDFWKDANSISSIALQQRGWSNADPTEYGLTGEIQIAERYHDLVLSLPADEVIIE